MLGIPNSDISIQVARDTAIVDLLVLEDLIAEVLDGSKGVFDVLKWAVFDCDPGEHDHALGDGTQVRIEGTGAVGILDIDGGHDRLVDWLQQVLVCGRIRARQVGFLCSCRNEQKLAQLSEAFKHLCGLLDKRVSNLGR